MNEVFRMYDSWLVITYELLKSLFILMLIIFVIKEPFLQVIFSIISIIYCIFFRYYYRYKFYEDYIECNIGFWNIKQTRLSYNRISSIETKQNIILKLFNVGSIKISDFSARNVIVFRLIPNYRKIKNLMSFKESV